MGRVPPFDPSAQHGPVLRSLAWAARKRPVTWFLVNVGNRIDPALMRMSGGRVKTTLIAPTVLLTHTGARSERKRTTPLAYFTDGDDVIVIASRGGHEHNPAWLHNIRAHPEVELWSGGRGGRYRAREAEGPERARLWQLATTFYPGFATYQERAGDRVIPVVVCSPED
jgi:deazaflavin-dependent oxidoreductase (nitroreductase family)